MDVKFDISQYVASVKMSKKIRILVEGKDDRAHIKNLIATKLPEANIMIDTAENIKGDCSSTAKNNRAKIDKIHHRCKTSSEYSRLYFLCDREFLKFDIQNEIRDLMLTHESDGNLNWTLGHSLENYFFDSELIKDAFSYLSGSEFKLEAKALFQTILPSALKLVATMTLAARDIKASSYPQGTIHWDSFLIDGDCVKINEGIWLSKNGTQKAQDFVSNMNTYSSVIDNTSVSICTRICRGHTAVLMLQRIFSACLYFVGHAQDRVTAEKDASEFTSIKESSITNALCEAWIRSIKNGNANYPNNLVSSIKAL